MKNMFKLGLILALYTTAACVGLALVFGATDPIIKIKLAEKEATELQALFPSGDRFEKITGAMASPDSSIVFEDQYAAYRGSELIGVAIRAKGPSYSGPAVILSGIGIDGKVSGIKILDIQDTPGLGANASSDTYFVDRSTRTTFYGQFSGKNISDNFEPNADVVAITAATITSKAVSSVVKASGQAADEWFKDQGGTN